MLARRELPGVTASQLNEVHKRLAEDDAVRYAIGAMQPIDSVYTKNTIAEGDRVRDQLRTGLPPLGHTPEYRYQGSVTNDTHVKAHSDIDLLVITDKFHDLKPPLTPATVYPGDASATLKDLRRRSAAVLRAAFPAATLDESKTKALSLSGGSLRRDVDVVVSSWWNTPDWASSFDENQRGVKILDNATGNRIANLPFLHNLHLGNRDSIVRGNLRRVVRLLKSLKYDADREPTISSYDIAAIVYNMPVGALNAEKGLELTLVQSAEEYLRSLMADHALRSSLDVPNRLRKVFCAEGATEQGLGALYSEVTQLRAEIEAGLARSFRKLATARLAY